MYNEIHLNKIDIAGEPPAEEPARQYYFMAKCQDWVREFEQKKGRRPTAFIQTFGCQMNARDSEKLLGILEEAGFVQGADENSDFVLYNTCTVRENANLKVYGRLGYLGGLKRKNPDMLIALCGCMMQEPQVVEKIRKSYRLVDIIFGTHNIFRLAELIFRRLTEKKMVVDIWEGTDADRGGSAGGAEVSLQIRSQHHVRLQQFLQLLYRSLCAGPGAEPESGGHHPRDRRPGGRRRGGGDAFGAERQFLRKDIWRSPSPLRSFCGGWSRSTDWSGSGS